VAAKRNIAGGQETKIIIERGGGRIWQEPKKERGGFERGGFPGKEKELLPGQKGPTGNQDEKWPESRGGDRWGGIRVSSGRGIFL